MDEQAQLALESIRTYKKIFELSPEAIIILDAKGNMLERNARGNEWLGYSAEDYVGKNISELVYLPNKSKVLENFAGRMKGENIPPYEADFIAKDGKRKVGRITATTIMDENNNIIGALVMVADITEHKLADEALAETEEKWHSLVKNAPNKILIVNKEGIIQFINNKGLFKSKQYIGESLYTSINPADRALAKKVFERVCRSGKPGRCIVRGAYTPGSWFDMQLGAINHNGEFCSVMIIVVDITESKKMESLLRDKEKKLSTQNIILNEKNIAMTEFARQLKEEKLRIAEQLQINLERLVMPLLTKIRSKSSKFEKIYIDLLAENLTSLTEPLGKKASMGISGLTKREIELCDMIKNGSDSRQIAKTLNISERTVGLVRYHIRKKLRIANKKINLSVYLKTL